MSRFRNPPHSSYDNWYNSFTNETIKANVTTNNRGFNDKHDFGLEPYKKAANERVVLFTGGSAAWGLGSTSTDTTIAGRMEHYLNAAQSKWRYTVVNQAMGSWIAYQQFIGLELWGAAFDPDWVVSMDGHNDAGVGCAYSQGVMNPLYFPAIKDYSDAYLGNGQVRPVFYRGWLENEIIKYSAAYRGLTGQDYIPNPLKFETNPDTGRAMAGTIIVPTKLGEAREMLTFYLKSEEAMLRLYPRARYILSTQPLVNQFDGDFTDVYGSDDPAIHQAAMDKRIRIVEEYLAANAEQTCSTTTYQPSFTYVYVNGALLLERMAEKMQREGKFVEYHNTGRLFPNPRDQRMPFFVDAVHISDKGADVIGRFFAERILAADVETSAANPASR